MFLLHGAKPVTILLIVMLVFATLVGCGPAEQPSEGETGTGETPAEPSEPVELVVAMDIEPDGTDQQQCNTVYAFVHSLTSTPPMSLGLNNDEILPWGAQEVEISDDGLEIRLTFDPTLTYHNGEPITAESVKKSIERYIDTSPYGFDYDPVGDLNVDGDTLIITLKEPGPALLVVLASEYAAPVEVGAPEEMGADKFHRATVTNGPFKVEEWVEGSEVTLVKNEDYKDFLPLVDNNGPFHFDRVKTRFIPEGFTRVSELQAGNVDVITNVPSEFLDQLRSDPDIELMSFLKPSVRHMQLNMEQFPFQEKEARLAVAYALDREELKGALKETIEPLYGLIAKAMIGYHAETEAALTEQFGTNVDKAKGVLAQAGWEDTDGDGIVEKDGKPFSFTMAMSSTSGTDKKTAPIMQSQLKKAGIDMQLREYDSKYIRQLIEEKNFEAVLRNWFWLDPGGVWPGGITSSGHLAPWSTPEVDELVDTARTTPDTQTRAENWAKVSTAVWEDVPLIPLYSDREFTAMRSYVKGIKLSVSGTFYFNDMTLEGK